MKIQEMIFNAEIDSKNYVIKGVSRNDIVDLLNPDIPKAFRRVIVDKAIRENNHLKSK